MKRSSDAWLAVLWAITTLLVPVAIWAVFIKAPEEKVMGAVQKVFYFHVPSAMVTYTSVLVLLGGSMAYLWTRNRKWDNLSRSATATGLLFCTIVLITGPIWAKPAWGAWWTWEPRLTTTLVLWFLLVACLMVRHYAENRDVGARLASVVGIVAALDVPIVHRAVQWGGQHPIVFEPGKEDAISPAMSVAFRICMLTMFLLAGLIMALRYRIASLEDRTEIAAERILPR